MNKLPTAVVLIIVLYQRNKWFAEWNEKYVQQNAIKSVHFMHPMQSQLSYYFLKTAQVTLLTSTLKSHITYVISTF